jgi:hypothetical protein
VYRGLPRIVVTVPSVQPVPGRCGLRAGSAADGHGIAVSLSGGDYECKPIIASAASLDA